MRGGFIGVWAEACLESWWPLIEHENVLRAVDMRDLVAMPILLAVRPRIARDALP